MIKKYGNRFLALIMTLAMVMSLMPVLTQTAAAADKIYFTEGQNVDSDTTTHYRVCSANVTVGSSPEQLYYSAAGTPEGVAVDPTTGFVYFSELNGGVFRCNTSGGEVVTLNASAGAKDIAIDTVHSKLYYGRNRHGRRKI